MNVKEKWPVSGEKIFCFHQKEVSHHRNSLINVYPTSRAYIIDNMLFSREKPRI